MDPLTNGTGSGSHPQRCKIGGALMGAASEPFSGQHGLIKKLPFLGDLRQLLGTLRPGLGDHLVTMGEHVNPLGAMQHQLGPPSSASWPMKMSVWAYLHHGGQNLVGL